jgi:hypothetical protein
MGSVSIQSSAVGRWGATTGCSTHKVYEHHAQKSPLHVVLSTDFALHNFYVRCFSNASVPFVREVPQLDCFKLAIVMRLSEDKDVLPVARAIQKATASGFFAGTNPDWRCVVSTASCGTEVITRLVFLGILLQSIATLASFHTKVTETAAKLTWIEALRFGSVPNRMVHWQERHGARGGLTHVDSRVVFRARSYLNASGEDDEDRIREICTDAATEAVETSMLCIPTSGDLQTVLPRAIYGHRLIRDWASGTGILNNKGAEATNSAMRIGDCFGFTVRLTSYDQRVQLYKILHLVNAKDCFFAMTERAVGVYAYFLDLDIKVKTHIDDWKSCTRAFTRAAIQAVCEIYAGSHILPHSVVSASNIITSLDGRQIAISDANGVEGKSGVHLVFDNVSVDKELALCLRKEVVARLEGRPDLQTYPVDLDKVVDESVYKSSSGLRVLGAVKTTKRGGKYHAQLTFHVPLMVAVAATRT